MNEMHTVKMQKITMQKTKMRRSEQLPCPNFQLLPLLEVSHQRQATR